MANSSIAQNNSIFQAIREGTTFPEVFQAFNGGEMRRQGRFFVALCPFHSEKSPSFTIYPNRFVCYGCGEKGDGITFVAKLLGLRPLDAARAIAEKFGLPVNSGPLSREDRLRIAQAKAIRERERQLRDAFNTWLRETTCKIRTMTEAVRLELETKGLDIEPELLPLVHRLPLFEWWADTLSVGSDSEKIELFKNEDLKRWFS